MLLICSELVKKVQMGVLSDGKAATLSSTERAEYS